MHSPVFWCLIYAVGCRGIANVPVGGGRTCCISGSHSSPKNPQGTHSTQLPIDSPLATGSVTCPAPTQPAAV